VLTREAAVLVVDLGTVDVDIEMATRVP